MTEPKVFHSFAPKWEPIFWSLADYTPEQLLTSGAAWLEMMSVLRVERAEAAVFLGVLAEAMKRLAALQGHDETRWSDCLRVILTYASWRRPPEEAEALQNIVLEANLTRKAEVQQMIQSIASQLVEQGRIEGRAEGELQTHRENLRRLLLKKFAQIPEDVLQRIASCTDIERLKTAIDRVLDWKSVDEFDL